MAEITKRFSNRIPKSKKKLIKVADLKNLRKVREDVAGIDVGAENHFVASPDPQHGGKIVVQRFGSFTSNLRECVDWLVKCKIKSAAMEATGVYWMVLYAMLKEAEIDVVLVNAQDFKKMKDKKTDVCDAEYLQLYHS
jgi:transposase